jgi:hypothetical protein
VTEIKSVDSSQILLAERKSSLDLEKQVGLIHCPSLTLTPSWRHLKTLTIFHQKREMLRLQGNNTITTFLSRYLAKKMSFISEIQEIPTEIMRLDSLKWLSAKRTRFSTSFVALLQKQSQRKGPTL